MANRSIGRPFSKTAAQLAQTFEDYRSRARRLREAERIESHREPRPPTFCGATGLSRASIERHLRAYGMPFPLWPLEEPGERPHFAWLINAFAPHEVLWGSAVAVELLGYAPQDLQACHLGDVIEGLDEVYLEPARTANDGESAIQVPLAYLRGRDREVRAVELQVSFGPKNRCYWITGHEIKAADVLAQTLRALVSEPKTYVHIDRSASLEQAHQYAAELNRQQRRKAHVYFNAEALPGSGKTEAMIRAIRQRNIPPPC